jgi:DNA invertase Pin-like site-specific DNA recombinase
MREAVIYTRVSSREQQQEGFSLFAQSKLLREYATQQGFEVVQAFEDVETAKATGRKQFGRMVDFFERNPSCRTLLVEKTDRISRNFRDAVTLEDLELEVHFVKEGQIISKEAKSQAVLMYGLNLVLARHYSNNLREEVKKGMREKAMQGIYPGRPPFGYRNNRADRTVEVNPLTAPIVERIFALYATGEHSLTTLRKVLELETGRTISRNNLHLMLNNCFYEGLMQWSGEVYQGRHPVFVDRELIERVREVTASHNRAKYSRREVAFRGLMRCAYDGCLVTADVQKEKYIYYRCTGSRGKCGLPRLREQDIVNRMGETLKGLHVPEEFAAEVIAALRREGKDTKANQSRLRVRLAELRDWMDQAYSDKVAGRIPEHLWERRMKDWQEQEQQIKSKMRLDASVLRDRATDAQRLFSLANRAYSLYLTHDVLEKAKLLKVVLAGCSIDAGSVRPTYRKPFEMIRKRAGLEEWSEYLAGDLDWSSGVWA